MSQFIAKPFQNYILKEIRELFRENLLPNLGGKIPDTAFLPDRVALNRLNQNGLFTPDGIYLQQREANHIRQRFPLENTLKVTKNF